MRSRVVLPEPLEPISAQVAPVGMERLTSAQDLLPRKRLINVLQLQHFTGGSVAHPMSADRL